MRQQAPLPLGRKYSKSKSASFLSWSFPPGSRLEQKLVRIRTVYGDMAQCARLIFLRLVVEGRYGGRRGIDRQCVAFQAKKVDLAALQQPGICRTMRRVAGHASLGLHRRMFERKRPGLVRVTVVANHVLCRGRAQLPVQESSVRIVAIAAGDQAFVHAMVKRPGKLWLHFQMTAVAKLGLAFFQ